MLLTIKEDKYNTEFLTHIFSSPGYLGYVSKEVHNL